MTVDEEKKELIKAGIVKYLWRAHRGNPDHLLRGARRNGVASATRQEVREVLDEMLIDETIMRHPRAGSIQKPMYILTPEKIEELRDNADTVRSDRKTIRDNIETARG